MANVDIAIVNVATPSIHRDLHASGGALEFVVSGYVLAFAMLIITGARLGRIAGYRRMYLAGLAGFTLASLACSLAPGAVPPHEAADLSGLVNTSAQVAAVAGVAAYGTVYFALAGLG
jgi:MFS family permease